MKAAQSTPWAQQGADPTVVVGKWLASSGTRQRIASCNKAEYAALIVRAVNSHGDLLAALRRLIGAVEAMAVHERGGPPVNWQAVDDSQDAARAAIERAEGGQP